MWQQRGAHPPPESAPAPVPQTQSRAPHTPAPAPAPRTEAPAPAANDAGTRLDAVVGNAEEKRLVLETIAKIERGAPMPYRKDGSVFSNRERVLPQKPRGYYREYTVPTPGEGDRGARRIVRGAEGETYYSRDHDRTFVRL